MVSNFVSTFIQELGIPSFWVFSVWMASSSVSWINYKVDVSSYYLEYVDVVILPDITPVI